MTFNEEIKRFVESIVKLRKEIETKAKSYIDKENEIVAILNEMAPEYDEKIIIRYMQLVKDYAINLENFTKNKNKIYNEIEKSGNEKISEIHYNLDLLEKEFKGFKEYAFNCNLNAQKYAIDFNLTRLGRQFLENKEENKNEIETKINELKEKSEKEMREVKENSIRSLTGFFFIFTLIASNIGLIFKASESLTALCFAGLALMINSIILLTAVTIYSVINKNAELNTNNTKNENNNRFFALYEVWLPLIGIVFGLLVLTYDNIRGDKKYLENFAIEQIKENEESKNEELQAIKLKQNIIENENVIIKSKNEYLLERINEMEKKIETIENKK